MRLLCGLLGLLALGLVSGTAVAGLSGSAGPAAITGTLSVTTAVPTTAVPTVTVTLPVTTVTSPTTVPTLPVTVTVPVTTSVTVPTTTVTTTAPLPVTTTTPSVTSTVPRVTTTAPLLTTTVPTVTARVPVPVTTATTSTTPGPTDPGSTQTATAGPGARSTSEPAPRRAAIAPAGSTWAFGATVSTGFATPERRAIVFRFRLDRPGLVRVTVVQAAPGCRVVGSFGIRGRTGSNTVRFGGTLGRLRLRPGVYEVRLWSPGAVSRRTWVRISAAGRLSILPERTGCATPTEPAGPLGATRPPQFPMADGGSAPRGGVASARFSRTGSKEGRGAFSPGDLVADLPGNPLGVLLLGMAALLVAIAALPRAVIPARRLGALVADRRLELASVGVTVFVTAVLTLTLA